MPGSRHPQDRHFRVPRQCPGQGHPLPASRARDQVRQARRVARVRLRQGPGFAYEPGLDHPLLIPSAGDARPGWTLDDFKRAVSQSRGGKIAVIQLHGVPDTAHSWVNTPAPLFESYVKYLADNGYRVIALRDLARYVDPTIVPSNPWGVIEDRTGLLSSGRDGSNARPAVRGQVVIDAHRRHLGTAGRPEWQEFAGSEPEGRGTGAAVRGQSKPGRGDSTDPTA